MIFETRKDTLLIIMWYSPVLNLVIDLNLAHLNIAEWKKKPDKHTTSDCRIQMIYDCFLQ